MAAQSDEITKERPIKCVITGDCFTGENEEYYYVRIYRLINLLCIIISYQW